MYLLLFLLLLCTTAWADHSTLRNDTINTLPDSNLSSFRSQSQIMWDHELADMRYSSFFTPFIKSGGVHPTSASLTSTAFATEAYVPERINQTATAITYITAATDTCFTIISADNNGIAGWTRVGSTAYYYKCTGGAIHAEPPLPLHSAFLMQLTISGSAITFVHAMHAPNSSGDRKINAVRDCGVSPLSNNFTAAVWLSQTTLLQACIDSARRADQTTASTRATIYLPTGNYYLAARITIPQGITLIGDGKFSTILFTDTGFTDALGLIHFNGAGGLPATLSGVAVNCFGGCSGSSLGINVASNGTFLRNLWVSGFSSNILLASTDVFLTDFVSELAITGSGVSITSTHVTVSDGVTYQNPVGFAINNLASNSADRGPIQITNVRDTQSTVTGFALVGYNMQLTNISCWANDANKYSGSCIVIGESDNVTLTNVHATITNAQSTTVDGITLASASNNIIITGAKVRGWRYGISSIAATKITIANSHAYENYARGISITGGHQVVIQGNHAYDNGSAAVGDVGIVINNTTSSAHILVQNNDLSTSTGPQEYGLSILNSGANTTTVATGNSGTENSIAAYNEAGTTSENRGIRNHTSETGIWKTLQVSGTINFGTVNASSDVDSAVVLAQVSVANVDICIMVPQEAKATTGLVYSCRVSADNELKARASNITHSNIVTTSGTFNFFVIKTAR